MKKATKRLFLLVPLVILMGFVGIYFLFPGVAFDLLREAERSAGGLEQRGIDVNGLHMEYLEGGQGDVLLLLHGFGANKDNWTRIGKYLTPYFRVVAPDLPGFGESSPDAHGDYTVGVQADRVKAFVRALGIESFHLGGNSMGGHIAGVYAAIYPKDLKSLLLLAPAGVASAEPSEVFRLLKEGKKNPLVVESAEDYEHLLDFIFVKRPFIPCPIKKFLIREAIRHRQLNATIFKQLHRSFENLHLESLLKGHKTPTLIVWGEKDRILHVSGAGILESVMGKAKAKIMNGVGHVPMIEKPEETARLYLSFLDLNQNAPK